MGARRTGLLSALLSPTPWRARPQARHSVWPAALVVARGGVEPPTFHFSGGRSYQLSYLPNSPEAYRPVWAGPNRVYDDRAYGTFEGAMFDTIRALVKTGKPVGLLGRGGAHALMVTGYYGLTGDPFAKDTAGNYTNKITLGGFYVTDPLSSSKMTSKAVSWNTLKFSGDYRIRFKPYYETDSTLDDPYTPGVRRSRDEWYRRFVVILPMR